MSDVRMDVKNTDYDAAQALLDLQGNIKTDNSEAFAWRNNDKREDMEKAAQLFWNCFISSEVPTTRNTSHHDPNSKIKTMHYPVIQRTFSHNVPTPISKENKQGFYNVRGHKISALIEGNNTKSSQIQLRYDKSTKNISNHNSIKMKKVQTRDVATQTEERHFSPNVELMETTIQQLCKKIKSLEAQLKEANIKSAERSGFISSENETNFDNEDVSDGSNNDFDMNMSEERVNASKASQYSEHSHKVHYEQTDYSRRCNSSHSRNNSYRARVLVNHNVYTNSNDLIPIGDGHASVPSRILKHINWNSYTSATRKLLTAVFTRRILATHSLTGKPSPAFPNKPAKKKLDPALVNDIVQTVVERCSVPENVVRTSITTKCADESKMFRTRQRNNKKRVCKKNRENVSPPTSDSETENY